MDLKKILPALSLLLCVSVVSRGQNPAFSPAMQEANAFWQQQKWPEAKKAYENVLKAEPDNAVAWARFGMALHSLGEYPRAIEAFQKSIDLPPQPPPPGLFYRLARAYARLNQKDKAFESMTKAVQNGFNNSTALAADPDLAELRADPRWKEIDAKIISATKPCTLKAEFRQLDFWLGDWDLQNRAGQTLGSSKIELILESCVVHEIYRGPNNYVGQAFHFFNAATGKWDQHYIDTVGVPFDWTGEFKDNRMLYTRESVTPKGDKLMQKMMFTKMEGDRVHQLFEQSTDGGKTWQTGFDGIYVRKKTGS